MRITRTDDGRLVEGRSRPGRGAWLCRRTAIDCLDLAVRRKAFARALRAEPAPDAAARLRAYLAERARL